MKKKIIKYCFKLWKKLERGMIWPNLTSGAGGAVVVARPQHSTGEGKAAGTSRSLLQEPPVRYLRGALGTDAIHATVGGLLRRLLNQASLARGGDHLLGSLHTASTTLSTALCGGGKT